MALLKRIIFWGILAGIFYSLLSFHFIYFGGTDVKLLRKSELSLNYTFFSVTSKSNEWIMSKKPLRRDGIADLLVEAGRMSEAERERILNKYEYEDGYY